MSEPTVIEATVRETIADEIDIECRFSDGQKFAAVKVSAGFDSLAFRIACFLSGHDDRPSFGRAVLLTILNDWLFFDAEESESWCELL